MKPVGFIKENTMRPAVLELLKQQSPLHLSAIHSRLEAVLGKKLVKSTVSSELGRMVTAGILRRAGGAVYEKAKQPTP